MKVAFACLWLFAGTAHAAEPAAIPACPLRDTVLEVSLSNPRTRERFDLSLTPRSDCAVAVAYSSFPPGGAAETIRKEYGADVMAELWRVLGDAIDIARLRSDRPCPQQRLFTVRRGGEVRRFCDGSDAGKKYDAFRGEIQLLLTYR